jgi:hypothetical protein
MLPSPALSSIQCHRQTAYPSCIHPSRTYTIVSQTNLLNKRCTLGNVVALAGQNARSDRVCLDFLVTFFIKKKGKDENCM